jgi:hypothetical protein
MPFHKLDAKTLAVARRVFQETLLALPTDQRTPERKSWMASQVLALAAAGETNHLRLKLRLRAMMPRSAPSAEGPQKIPTIRATQGHREL